MIKYDPKSWVSLIFHAYSRRIMRMLLPNMLFIGAFTAAFAVFHEEYFPDRFDMTTTVHSLLGFVLGLFLVFRTNTAYDRWWEGRKLWGALVNNCRNLAMKVNAMVPKEDQETRAFFARQIGNYPHTLKGHLRSGPDLNDLEGLDQDFDPPFTAFEHSPNRIATALYEKAQWLLQEKKINGEQFLILDKELKALTDILGGCERIKNTPIPYSYSMYMKKFIFIYIITLPFGFINQFHYWTIPVVILLFYILVSTELIAEEIEDPFGTDDNDLDTDGLSVKIRANVKEILS